jgi:hypothetical protein
MKTLLLAAMLALVGCSAAPEDDEKTSRPLVDDERSRPSQPLFGVCNITSGEKGRLRCGEGRPWRFEQVDGGEQWIECSEARCIKGTRCQSYSLVMCCGLITGEGVCE